MGKTLVKQGGFPAKQFSLETSGNSGGEITLLDGDVKVAFVPAVHSSSIEVDDGTAPLKNSVYAGEPAGFIITVKNGPTIYHTGDTDLFSDMTLIQDFGKIDIMMVCIGDKFTMGPRRAAKAVRLVEPEMVIPMHFSTLPALTGTAEQFVQETKMAIGRNIVTVMQTGETLSWERKPAGRKKPK